jgi:hypothetical protein
MNLPQGLAKPAVSLFHLRIPCSCLTLGVDHAKIIQVNIFLHLLQSRRLLLGCLWLCMAVSSSAVTLGPNTRSAVLGQPLDLSIQMMLEAGDNPQSLCLEADVFYAEKMLGKADVGVTTEKVANTQDWMIHVRAAAPVEGAVVTVHLRGGCVQKTSRRYVVLVATKSRSAVPDAQALAVAGPSTPASADPAVEKAQALENELRQVRDNLQKSQSALAESKAQLEKAEGERYRKVLMYGFAALVLIVFAVLFFLGYMRSVAREPSSALAPLPTGMGADGGPSTLMSLVEAGPSLDGRVNESLFDELRRVSRSSPPSESVPPLPPRDRPRFSVSVPFVPRTVKVPELFDLQQEVEFFTSLKQQDKAIELLRDHLVSNVKTSALVYLDLLDLYHQTGKEQDYEDLRDDFNRVFNTRIGPFARYVPAPAGGPVYAGVLLRIQAAWPGREVFKIIEDALFREPGNPAEVLALEEYQELLLLYSVVREIIELESGYAGSGDTQWPELAMQPRSSPRLGVDIDLTQFSEGVSGKRDHSRGASASPDSGRDSVRAGTASGLAEPFRAAQQKESWKAAASGISDTGKPTGLDSLVDFDDYDTGYRPDDFDKPRS